MLIQRDVARSEKSNLLPICSSAENLQSGVTGAVTVIELLHFVFYEA
jgi:hypothetical protein